MGGVLIPQGKFSQVSHRFTFNFLYSAIEQRWHRQSSPALSYCVAEFPWVQSTPLSAGLLLVPEGKGLAHCDENVRCCVRACASSVPEEEPLRAEGEVFGSMCSQAAVRHVQQHGCGC